jgi:hypothetical protein
MVQAFAINIALSRFRDFCLSQIPASGHADGSAARRNRRFPTYI